MKNNTEDIIVKKLNAVHLTKKQLNAVIEAIDILKREKGTEQ